MNQYELSDIVTTLVQLGDTHETVEKQRKVFENTISFENPEADFLLRDFCDIEVALLLWYN